jgi:hypothetical protein
MEGLYPKIGPDCRSLLLDFGGRTRAVEHDVRPGACEGAHHTQDLCRLSNRSRVPSYLKKAHFVLLAGLLQRALGDQTFLVAWDWTSDWLLQIIMHDLAEAERKVGKDVDRGNDLEHRQLGNGCQSVR